MSRKDHREFHDLCKKLLSFEPNSRLGAAKAMEHEFFHLDITPEYSEASLLLYPDAPIPPPTMPPPVNAVVSKATAASLSGVSASMASAATASNFPPRGGAADATGPSGPSIFPQGIPPAADAAQQVLCARGRAGVRMRLQGRAHMCVNACNFCDVIP